MPKCSWSIIALCAACTVHAQTQGDVHPQQPQAEKPKEHKRFLGTGIGTYYPQSSVIRSLFDSTIRFSIYDMEPFKSDNWHVVPDFYAVTGNQGGNRFIIAPVSAMLQRAWGDNPKDAQPYFRVGVGVTYTDYNLTLPNNGPNVRGNGFGLGATIEAGLTFHERLRFSARYTAASKIDDLDFSGLTVSLQYGLIRF